MSRLLEGIDALEAGDWDLAHRIAQDDETSLGAWLHGIVHREEGDEGNARYWYARAGRAWNGSATTKSEMQALRDALHARGDLV